MVFGDHIKQEKQLNRPNKKQLVRKNRDVGGAGGVKDKDRKIVVDEEKILDVWQSY